MRQSPAVKPFSSLSSFRFLSPSSFFYAEEEEDEEEKGRRGPCHICHLHSLLLLLLLGLRRRRRSSLPPLIRFSRASNEVAFVRSSPFLPSSARLFAVGDAWREQTTAWRKKKRRFRKKPTSLGFLVGRASVAKGNLPKSHSIQGGPWMREKGRKRREGKREYFFTAAMPRR